MNYFSLWGPNSAQKWCIFSHHILPIVSFISRAVKIQSNSTFSAFLIFCTYCGWIPFVLSQYPKDWWFFCIPTGHSCIHTWSKSCTDYYKPFLLTAFSISFYTTLQPSHTYLVAAKSFLLALQILLCGPIWLRALVLSHLPNSFHLPQRPLAVHLAFISQQLMPLTLAEPFSLFMAYISPNFSV